MLRKTLAFLSFQSSQVTRMAIEAIAFLLMPTPKMLESHHSRTELVSCHELGLSSASPNQSLTISQMWIENLQEKRICAAVSGSLL